MICARQGASFAFTAWGRLGFGRQGMIQSACGQPQKWPIFYRKAYGKAACSRGSGARIAIQMHHRCALCGTAGIFAIIFGLLLTEGVALGPGAFRGFDATDATPAHTVFGGEWAHLIFRVMDPAAVAKYGFRHYNLTAIGTDQIKKNDMPVLQLNDIIFAKSFLRCCVLGHIPVTGL